MRSSTRGRTSGTSRVIYQSGAYGTLNADALSPARLDAHERCDREFEALGRSRRARGALREVDASLAPNATAECVLCSNSLPTTAAQATRRRRAALLPAQSAAAAALGEYRSDMATRPADGDAKNPRCFFLTLF